MVISTRNEFFYPALATISIALLIWQHFGMNKTIEVYPDVSRPAPILINDSISGGRSIGTVKNRDGVIELDCQLLKSPYTFAFCGFQIPLGRGKTGIDLTSFQSLDISLSLESKSKDTVMVYLQNSELDANRKVIERGNLRTINPLPGMSHYRLKLDSFLVPSWWLFAHADTAGTNGDPNLSNVTGVQISSGDNAFERSETIRVQRIELNGKWLSTQSLYLLLFVLWSVTIIGHAGHGLFRLREKLQKASLKASELEHINQFLSIEKDKYESMAKICPLTKAYNRAGIRDVLDHARTQYEEKGIPCSLILFDIDHFKLVNDTYGHDVGDEVLVALVDLIKKRTRKTDCLARWGGEEFLLICSNTPFDTAIGLAEKYRAAIAATPLGGHAITCSFGVSRLKSGELAASFKDADVALYHAKEQGRNRVASR